MDLSQLVTLCSSTLDPLLCFRKLESYRSARNSVTHFCDGRSPDLKTLFTKTFLRRYEEHMQCCGLMRNTSSYYMVTLRSLYACALMMKCVPLIPNLFDDVFTGSETTSKRAVSPETFALLYSADLSAVPRLELCRDLFVLSFLLQGMPFVDMAYLRKSDIHDGRITYCRRKTKGEVSVGLPPLAQELLHRCMAHTLPDSPYALPLLTQTGLAARKEYSTVVHRQNRQLKELSACLDLKTNLTTYVARHSWATIAVQNNVGISLVSQALGHHSEAVTRTYIDSFGANKLTAANAIVIEAMFLPLKERRVVPHVVVRKENKLIAVEKEARGGAVKEMPYAVKPHPRR